MKRSEIFASVPSCLMQSLGRSLLLLIRSHGAGVRAYGSGKGTFTLSFLRHIIYIYYLPLFTGHVRLLWS